MKTCWRCGATLTHVVWLEFNQKDGAYHKPGTVPEEDSQGLFEFGSYCAKVELRKQRDGQTTESKP